VPITFHCTCGQSITVPDQFAGKMGRCPGCKNPVQVPAASAAPAPAPAPMATPRPMPRTAPLPTPGGTAQAPAVTRPSGAAPGAQPRPSVARAPGAGSRPGPAKAAARLQVVNAQSAPGAVGRSFPLATGKAHVIGRDPQVDIPIPSDRISRRHCQLEPTADGVFVLTDLGSSNGTLVNQERINGRKVLLGGEYIQIGDVLLQFLDS